MFKKKGIAYKTFIFTSGIITLVVAISFAALAVALPDYYYYLKEKKLKENADILAHKLNSAFSEKECNELLSAFAFDNNANVIRSSGEQNEDIIFSTISTPDTMLKDSAKRVSVFFSARDEGHGEILKMQNTRLFSSETQPLGYAVSINNVKGIMLERDINNGIIDRIIVTTALQPIDEAKSVIVSLLPYLLAVDICVSLLAAYVYSKQFTKPIVKISEAASEMSKMVPNAKSGVRTGDELGELSENLDLMYGQLCDNITKLKFAMESKTDFMRAASHELKTPIAALNGIVEGMIDNVGVYKNKEKYLQESKKLIDKMAYLVNEILGASRLDVTDGTVLIEPLNLYNALNTALSGFSLIIEEKQLLVTMDYFEFIYDTDENLILTTLANVISNAVKYTDRGGKIIISFDDAVLSIENECENINEDELPKLTEPFYTINYSRNRSKCGTGLGLHIVHKNLERLGIPYKIENSFTGIKFSLFFC